MTTTERVALVVGFALLSVLAISQLGPLEALDLNANEDFVPLATQGFLTAVDGTHPEGSRRNNYIWSMQWWKGRLYNGTVRDVLCAFAGQGILPEEYDDICPPPGTLTPDQRAEIWRYTPGGPNGLRGTWRRVFQSPLLLGDRSSSPREIGYRNMIVCDAGGKQRLYVATFGAGGRVLYTPDGVTFQQASLTGLDPVNDLGYRAMACWKGRLWISPAGTSGDDGSFDPDIAFRKVLLMNNDPSNSSSLWVPVVNVANDPRLGDAGNVGIFSMTVFDDSLYLGVSNRTTGFEIWKADGGKCQPAPRPCLISWQKVIDNGGGRPVPRNGTPNNAGIADFGEFNGYLYWAASESGFFKITTAEMGRIDRRGRWDLIVGEPRAASAMAAYANFNCQREGSSCVPLSGQGPGFGPTPGTAGSATYIWQVQAHNGSLYAGTLDTGAFRDIPGAVEGFDLWGSDDGITWELVSDDGFGNPFNIGVRTMASTPLGLFVGTANPFTIEEGDNGGTGGAEVWLGIGD